jgi:hypothetical protein
VRDGYDFKRIGVDLPVNHEPVAESLRDAYPPDGMLAAGYLTPDAWMGGDEREAFDNFQL